MKREPKPRRAPAVQTVNLAEAIAATQGPDGILIALASLAGPINDANAVLQNLYDRRRALWAEGIRLGIGPTTLSRASGVADSMVHQSLRPKTAKAKATKAKAS